MSSNVETVEHQRKGPTPPLTTPRRLDQCCLCRETIGDWRSLPLSIVAILQVMVRIQDELNDGWDGVRNAYPPLLNTAQVAEMLDLNVRTVLAMANDGRLPASRLADSRKYHFLLEEVIKTLQSNKVTDQQQASVEQ